MYGKLAADSSFFKKYSLLHLCQVWTPVYQVELDELYLMVKSVSFQLLPTMKYQQNNANPP